MNQVLRTERKDVAKVPSLRREFEESLTMTNALLVYPRQPPTYWGSDFALDIVGVKSAFPPLGLLTIAAMFPPGYDLRVVDMNVTSLEDSDLEWADIVFTSTMIVQRISLENVIERCNRAGVPVVAGGPHPTTFHDEIEGVSHFVLDEAEENFPEFLRDLASGNAKTIYRAPRKPDVTQTPVPRFDLIDMNGYHSMGVQFSRGCPFDCEFCDIIKLYGQVPRTKSPDQVVKEFDTIYELGWRGPVFLVDDNFIGNKRAAMRLLPEIAAWQKERGHPFTLSTEASVNLARMDELMDIMIDAGFDTVFLGIETPNPKALLKTKKPQNVNKRDDNYLFNAVRTIQGKGMQVQGGFILGLDGDDEGVFDAQIEFIRDAGIPVAPIYLLTALRGTDMYERLRRENRLIDVPIGTSATTLNFKTEMDQETLIEGYMRVTATLYDPDSRELPGALPDASQEPDVRTAPLQAEEQERRLCGPDGRAQPAFGRTAPRLHEFHRQGLQGTPKHASQGGAPRRHGLPFREDHPAAEHDAGIHAVPDRGTGWARRDGGAGRAAD